MFTKENFKVEKRGAFNTVVWVVVGLALFFWAVKPAGEWTGAYVKGMLSAKKNGKAEEPKKA